MFYVNIYTGYAHWDKIIDEICDSFETEKQAIEYAKTIEKYRPNYKIEIFYE